mmetsp:Transcript_33684/g.99008  ORF Transcript_33684/g.99008 Transcript_33684/m.99008 type:complete len:238 (-) Transcript_33684:24-737(-)
MAAVVKAVLRAPHAVQVDEDAQSYPVADAEDALQLVDAPRRARLERLVRLPHPVAHRDADRVDALRDERLELGLGHPLGPVLAQLPVALVRAEHPAEVEHVHRRLVGRLVLELVEEARRHPRLQHHPAAQVDAAQLWPQQVVAPPLHATAALAVAVWVADKVGEPRGVGQPAAAARRRVVGALQARQRRRRPLPGRRADRPLHGGAGGAARRGLALTLCRGSRGDGWRAECGLTRRR